MEMKNPSSYVAHSRSDSATRQAGNESERFTPGPWHTKRGDSVVYIRSSTINDIAQTNSKAYWQRADSVDEANATLISAAPDLYAALKAMLVAFSMENIGVDASMRRVEAKRFARAALAKATGAVTSSHVARSNDQTP